MEMTTLYDYLRLCGRPHKRRYVAMSVMLSSVTTTSFCLDFVDCVAT